MHAAFTIDELVHRHVPTLGDQVARAFLVEGEHLRYRPVEPLDRMHTRLLHTVLGMSVPFETGKVRWYLLYRCLEVREKLFWMLQPSTKGLPPVIKGDHVLLRLGGHTAVVEDHVDAVLGPPGVGVDCVPLEGRG